MLDEIDEDRVAGDGSKGPLSKFEADGGRTISLILNGDDQTRRRITMRQKPLEFGVGPGMQDAHISIHISPIRNRADARGVRVSISTRRERSISVGCAKVICDTYKPPSNMMRR